MEHSRGTQPTNLLNLARFLAADPRRAGVLFKKAIKRLDSGGRYSEEENLRWIEEHRADSPALAKQADPALWKEAQEFGAATRKRAAPILASVPFDMGAGGDYEFLYWLTRKRRPEVIVETGVSSGWSTQAFLTALDRNGSGRLYSSDFPYFRVKDPEKYIGIVVDPTLKGRWELSLDGDSTALPRIVNEVGAIDLFHYDSDKSRSGREFAVSTIVPKLRGPLIMDDIANDSWFKEYAEAQPAPFQILGGAGIVGSLTE